MNTDLLIHVDEDDAATVGLALNNINNYFGALTQPPQVILVANGPAVRQFTKDGPHAEALARLHKAGVKFELCSNALKKFDIDHKRLHPSCTVIPAGMVELVRLQREGFAYIKP